MPSTSYTVDTATLEAMTVEDLAVLTQAIHAELAALEDTYTALASDYGQVVADDAAREVARAAAREAAFVVITEEDVQYRVRTGSFIWEWKTYPAADLLTNAPLRAAVVAAGSSFLQEIEA